MLSMARVQALQHVEYGHRAIARAAQHTDHQQTVDFGSAIDADPWSLECPAIPAESFLQGLQGILKTQIRGL